MKKIIIKNCMKHIKKNTEYDDTKLKEIEYGLLSIYLTLSKIVLILIISLYLGIIKEVLIFMVFFNIIRSFSFGLHATKSWICLIFSTSIFIGIPFIAKKIIINKYILIFIGLIATLLIYKNAPADTYKRPIVSKKRRIIYKYVSLIISIIYINVSFFINRSFISNSLIFSLVLENILISPSTYKIFKLPYNNYINYLKKHPDLVE